MDAGVASRMVRAIPFNAIATSHTLHSRQLVATVGVAAPAVPSAIGHRPRPSIGPHDGHCGGPSGGKNQVQTESSADLLPICFIVVSSHYVKSLFFAGAVGVDGVHPSGGYGANAWGAVGVGINRRRRTAGEQRPAPRAPPCGNRSRPPAAARRHALPMIPLIS